MMSRKEWAGALLWVLAVGLVSPAADAAQRRRAAKRPCAVLLTEGSLARSASGALAQRLKARYTLVPASEAAAALRRTGGSSESSEDLAALARGLACPAVVAATSLDQGQRDALKVKVVDGRGEVLLETRWKTNARGVSSAVSALWPKLSRALGQAQPAPAEPLAPKPLAPPPGGTEPPTPLAATEPAATPPEPAATPKEELAAPRAPEAAMAREAGVGLDEGAAAVASRRPMALELRLGATALRRTFTFNDDPSGTLPTYKLNRAPALTLGLDWFPAAHFSEGVLANVGLTGSYSRIFLVKTLGPTGEEYGTGASDLAAGLMVRLPLGPAEAALSVRYGRQDFTLTSAQGGEAPFPDVSYRYITPDVRLRLGLGQRWRVYGRAAWLVIQDSGELASENYFPRQSVGAAEGELALGLLLAPAWELRLGADYRRYFFDLEPEPGDPLVAGGALDEYLTGTVTLAFHP